MEWGSITYIGQHRVLWCSIEENRCRALTSLPQSPLLLCLPHQIIFQSQHGMEVKANMILLCPYQYMIEDDMVWMQLSQDWIGRV